MPECVKEYKQTYKQTKQKQKSVSVRAALAGTIGLHLGIEVKMLVKRNQERKNPWEKSRNFAMLFSARRAYPTHKGIGKSQISIFIFLLCKFG